jgi:hypothetical protein
MIPACQRTARRFMLAFFAKPTMVPGIADVAADARSPSAEIGGRNADVVGGRVRQRGDKQREQE